MRTSPIFEGKDLDEMQLTPTYRDLLGAVMIETILAATLALISISALAGLLHSITKQINYLGARYKEDQELQKGISETLSQKECNKHTIGSHEVLTLCKKDTAAIFFITGESAP